MPEPQENKTLSDRTFELQARMRDIIQQLKFAKDKQEYTRISLLEDYARDFAKALLTLLEWKEKGF